MPTTHPLLAKILQLLYKEETLVTPVFLHGPVAGTIGAIILIETAQIGAFFGVDVTGGQTPAVPATN